MNILHGIAFLFFKYPYEMILFRMNTAISKIVVIVAVLGIVVSTIGSSAAVRAEVVSKVEPILGQIRLS